MTTRKPYRLSDFDFDLPSEQIAQVPAPERSGSRLLHVAGARLVDLVFGALPELLVPGDLLVFNDTRVVRSRIVGRKHSGGRVELMLERIVAPDEAWMQLRASHPPRIGARIDLPGGSSATTLERDGRFFRLRFDGRMLRSRQGTSARGIRFSTPTSPRSSLASRCSFSAADRCAALRSCTAWVS